MHRIRVYGLLDQHRCASLGDLTVRPQVDRTTLLACLALDQAALPGFLRVVCDVALLLLTLELEQSIKDQLLEGAIRSEAW